MDINKADRVTLKSYFRKNLVPTESNFADLIDGLLNQKDDGIVKLPGDPLCVAMAGDPDGPQKLLNFYVGFGDDNPAWTLQLNPRSDSNKPKTAKAGFSISDGQGVSRLFIDPGTGNIGIGTITPDAALDIANLVRVGLDEGGSGPKSISFARDAGDEINAGKITYKGGFGDALNLIGAGATGAPRKIKLYDNVEVIGTIQVNGSATLNAVTLGGFTSANADEWPKVVWYRDTAASWDEGLIKHSAARGLFNRSGFGIHMHSSREWGIWSTGWDALFGVEGGSGNTVIKGGLKIGGAMTPSAGSTETNGIMFPKDPGGGGSDAAWIRYYPRTGEACTLEIGISNDFNDHIALMPAGNVGIGTNNPGAKLYVEGSMKSPMWNVIQVFNSKQGGLPVKSNEFATGGGTLLIIASGSGWSAVAGNIGMNIQLDGTTIGAARSFTNEINSHKVFSCNPLVRGNIAAGSHTIALVAIAGTITDLNDWFNVTVLELPF